MRPLDVEPGGVAEEVRRRRLEREGPSLLWGSHPVLRAALEIQKEMADVLDGKRSAPINIDDEDRRRRLEREANL